jgi:hypothetical protein
VHTIVIHCSFMICLDKEITDFRKSTNFLIRIQLVVNGSKNHNPKYDVDKTFYIMHIRLVLQNHKELLS